MLSAFCCIGSELLDFGTLAMFASLKKVLILILAQLRTRGIKMIVKIDNLIIKAVSNLDIQTSPLIILCSLRCFRRLLNLQKLFLDPI